MVKIRERLWLWQINMVNWGFPAQTPAEGWKKTLVMVDKKAYVNCWLVIEYHLWSPA